MKVGVLIVAHYRLGQEMLQALRLIVPESPRFYAVGIEPKQSVDEMRSAIAEALAAADRGEGVPVQRPAFARVGVRCLRYRSAFIEIAVDEITVCGAAISRVGAYGAGVRRVIVSFAHERLPPAAKVMVGRVAGLGPSCSQPLGRSVPKTRCNPQFSVAPAAIHSRSRARSSAGSTAGWAPASILSTTTLESGSPGTTPGPESPPASAAA